MTPADIIQQRLHSHQISQHTFKTSGALVSHMGAVQAQDYAGAKWSVGLRSQKATDTEIEKALTDKTLVRTWMLRGTLHIVAAADAWWMLELLGPVVIARNAAQFRKHELDDAAFKKIETVITKLMKGGNQLTRKELFTKLGEYNIPTQKERGAHILYRAALDKLICLGSLSGKQETYTLLEEWLLKPKKTEHDEALAELAKRYFNSHGPATLQDFTWWSGLSAADAKTGLALIKTKLKEENVEGKTYWFFQHAILKEKKTEAFLLQGYDEYFIGYKDRSIILDPKYKKLVEPGNGFSPVIIVNGQVKGTWRRTIKKEKVDIETIFFSPLSNAEKEAVSLAGKQFQKFLNFSD